MVSLLLPIIYLSFISLGLPDALLGAAWSVMCLEFNVPVSFAGIISIKNKHTAILVNLTNILLSEQKARRRRTYGIRLHIWKIQREVNLNYTDGSKGL